MRLHLLNADGPRNRERAFTLAEVVISIAIVATIFGGMFVAYTQSTRRAQWTAYALAAQALGIQQLEQARSAVWDPAGQASPNNLTNLVLLSSSFTGTAASCGFYTFTGYSWTNLDLPTSGGNFVTATNNVTIKMLYYIKADGNTVSNAPFQMVRVDTVWPFTWGPTTRLYTNTICTYVSPDNRQNL